MFDKWVRRCLFGAAREGEKSGGNCIKRSGHTKEIKIRRACGTHGRNLKLDVQILGMKDGGNRAL